jgi:protein-tyrosine phosphatase family protein
VTGVDAGERSRVIVLRGVRNLRDIGGYRTTDGRRRTRWQTLYRSDCTDELDKSGQQCLLDAGLRTQSRLQGMTIDGDRELGSELLSAGVILH